jgi:excisionase family DNA binding protein
MSPNMAKSKAKTPSLRAAPQAASAAERTKEKPKGNEKEWFNPTEAMDYLGVSRVTLYKLMDEGMLPFYTIKGIRKRRIKKEDLDALMEKSTPGLTEKDGN